MQLRIDNDNDDSLALPGYMLNGAPLSRRVSTQQRFGKPGGFPVGDRRAPTRRITLESDITAENDTAFNAQLAAIVKIFEQRFAPYFLVDTDNSRRAEVELELIDPTDRKGLEKRHSPIRLDLIMLETYWEDLIETEVETDSSGLATGETLVINNQGEVDVYPIIEVSPTANNSAFTLFNNTTNDLISIGSTAFVPGTTLIIDSQDGTLILDDGTTTTEISSAIADGTGFLFFAVGNNSLQYDSAFGAVDVVVKYRQRYAF